MMENVTSGHNSPIIKGNKNKINISKVTYFVSGFITGVISSFIAAIIYNLIF